MTSETVYQGTSILARTQYSYDDAAEDGLYQKITKTVVGDTNAPSVVTTQYTDKHGNVVKTGKMLGGVEYFDTSTYDYAGNVLTVLTAADEQKGLDYTATYVYNEANQVVKAYNAEGNYTANTYDALGRLVQAADYADQLIAYAYNAQGIRTARYIVDETLTEYLLDGGNVVGEVEDSTVSATYLRGANLISCGTDYYLYNAHGDVVGLATSAGTVTKAYDYDAFGNEKNPDADDANPFRYCGEYYDTETGLYYLRARYYDPTVGRFTQADTHWNTANMIYGDNPQKINERQDALGLKTYSYAPQISAVMQSGNLYVYCINNPLLYTDPNGDFAKELTTRNLIDGAGGGGVAAGGGLLILLGIWINSVKDHIIDSLSSVSTQKQYKWSTEDHHIVAQRAHLAKPAAKILNEVLDGGVQNENNIVTIKTSIHRRLHTTIYYSAVNIIILEAYYSANGDKEMQKENVLTALQYLRECIQSLNTLAP